MEGNRPPYPHRETRSRPLPEEQIKWATKIMSIGGAIAALS